MNIDKEISDMNIDEQVDYILGINSGDDETSTCVQCGAKFKQWMKKNTSRYCQKCVRARKTINSHKRNTVPHNRADIETRELPSQEDKIKTGVTVSNSEGRAELPLGAWIITSRDKYDVLTEIARLCEKAADEMKCEVSEILDAVEGMVLAVKALRRL
jgi:hypothetical protein